MSQNIDGMDLPPDLEKAPNPESTKAKSVQAGESGHLTAFSWPWLRSIIFNNVEARGVVPVPEGERTDRSGRSLFTFWFTANCSLLPMTTGISGTLVYGLDLRTASLVIIFGSFLFMIPVAWMGTLGPKTGMRQVIQARFSFGIYFVLIMAILQLATLTGYCIITAIVSGQTLSSISEGSLNVSVGIVLTIIASLLVSFMGYRCLHYFEQYSWIPSLIAIIIATGLGGHTLMEQAETTAPTPRAVLSFLSLTASLCISWAALVSDFAVYISPNVSQKFIFSYVYAGYCIPTIFLMILGAAIGGAVPNVESWTNANTEYSIGGVMYAMCSSAGGFGKFVAVLLAFSVTGNTACTLYSLSISLQSLHPWLVRVPRYVFAMVITAIVIPVSIVAAANFYASLANFLSVIGYWTAIYIGITLTEHHYFRKGDCSTYNMQSWNVRQNLPTGWAAVATGILCVGLIVPSMDTAWYTGTFATHTGDIGMEVSMCLSCLVYIPLRTLDIHVNGK